MDPSRGRGTTVGGDETPLRYRLVFAFGVTLGTGVRLGLLLLPASFVERLRERVLPERAS